MLLQLLLPALSEEAVCGRREAAVDCRSRPSAARGVSFLRPLWVLLSNVVR